MSLVMAGCGGGGGGSSPAPSAPSPSPANAAITLSSGASEVSAGGNAGLTWSTTNATGCVASQGWSGAKAASGSESIGPITAATTFTLTCNGTAGGASDSKSVTVTPLLITTDYSKVRPLDTIKLTVNASGPVPPGATPGFTVLIDASGMGTFQAQNTVEVAGLVADNTVTLAAPILEAYQPVTAAARFALKVRREAGGLTSNTLDFRYAPIVIPAGKHGLARASLEIVDKYALMSNRETFAIGSTRVPGLLSDALNQMGNAAPLADIEAEAILQQLYGVSAVSGGTARKLTINGADDDLRPLVSLLPQRLRNAVDGLVDCIRSGFDAFTSFEIAGKICDVDDAAQIIRDDYIGGISDASSTMSNIAGMLSGMLPRRLANGIFAREIEHLAQSGAATQAAADYAQMALSVPGLTATPGSTADFVFNRLTDLGKQKIHDKIMERFGASDVERRLLELTGSQEAVSGAVDAFAGALQWFYNGLVDVASSATDSLEEIRSQPELYGGDPQPHEPITGIPIPGGVIPVDGTVQTPAAMCAQYPEIGQGAMALGFSSCQEFIAPFFDEKFFREVLKPMMDSWDLDALAACAANPDTPQCEALLERLGQQMEDFFDSLKEFGGDDFQCERAYMQFEARSGARTCVFRELVVMPLGTSLPGSRFSNWDFGGRSVFIYYSRDFIQPGNTCKPNYALVDFLGTKRCRWETLPLGKPAAYSLDPETGEKQVLEK
jgi:hypothetical protein